jgi:predicted dehydrogenase
MKIGVIGCGYVSDFYALCLRANAPEIELAAVYDPIPDRARSFAQTYSGRVYSSLDDLLLHPGLDAVLNLTPPEAHAHITESALRRGKHVYSETARVRFCNRARANRSSPEQ